MASGWTCLVSAGLLIGGALIQVSSWPAIFFVNLPVGVAALALGWPLLADLETTARAYRTSPLILPGGRDMMLDTA